MGFEVMKNLQGLVNARRQQAKAKEAEFTCKLS
jgi:hypothetical protein